LAKGDSKGGTGWSNFIIWEETENLHFGCLNRKKQGKRAPEKKDGKMGSVGKIPYLKERRGKGNTPQPSLPRRKRRHVNTIDHIESPEHLTHSPRIPNAYPSFALTERGALGYGGRKPDSRKSTRTQGALQNLGALKVRARRYVRHIFSSPASRRGGIATGKKSL